MGFLAKDEIARTLRDCRDMRGLSLSAVATRSGIAKSTLSDWENARKVPTGESLNRVLDLLRPNPGIRHFLLALADRSFAETLEGSKDYGMPLDLGQFLRALRFRGGTSQSEVAARIGVSQGTIAKWELGSTFPDGELLTRVLSSYGATTAEQQFLSMKSPEINGDRQDYSERLEAIDVLPVPLQELAYMALEMELWPMAMRNTGLLGLLVSCSSVRANLMMEQGRRKELAVLVRQILGQVKAHGFWTEGSLGYYSYLASELQSREQSRERLLDRMQAYSINIPDIANRYYVEGLFADAKLSAHRANELESVASVHDKFNPVRVWPYELDIEAAHAFILDGDPESAVSLLLPYMPDPAVGSHSFLGDSLSRVFCRACLKARVVPSNLDQILAGIPRDRLLDSTQKDWSRLERGLVKLRETGAAFATP